MKLELTNEEALSIFHTALCNGLGYVSGYGLYLDVDKQDYDTAREQLSNPCLEDVYIQILNDGDNLNIIDEEGDGDMSRVLNLEGLIENIKLAPIENVSNILNETDDAIDADVIIQTAFFKEVIFG